ncbi:hypothetical protein ABZ754_11325 [Micromonospora purpureochromogenes]|uniref:hypothetical protein n=1 Tax=Micromonospora purpureochromogenes TaxID=47872 RepID=UPI00340B0AD9
MTTNDDWPQVILNPDAGPRLIWENHVVLGAVQASLGLIGPNVRGIAVEAQKDRVTFHVALTQRSPQAEDDIEDMIFDFEALSWGEVPGGLTVDTVITVGDTGPEWTGYQWRRIFIAHS